jgi:membrane peptidoglycan carboxypeptidase
MIHQRRARRRAARNAPAKRALRAGGWALAVASVAAALLAVFALPAYSYITAALPAVSELETMLDPQTGALLAPTQFYDRSGEHLLFTLQPTSAPRVFVEAGDAPLLAAALIASSDPSFWQHDGALWTRPGTEPHTIAERLVANLLLAQEPDGWRKTLRTRVLASQATSAYGRAQVLTWALNSARFGNATFGAESAAQFYFGKSAAQLSLAEAAILAATAQAPAVNPLDAPEAAQQLGHLVLIAMHEQGRIDDNEFNQAISAQVVVTAQPASEDAFASLAAAQLRAALGEELAERGGLSVVTTLDFVMQSQLAETGANGVVLDPLNGRVLAMVGSQAAQPASRLLLPFVYLDAFASGEAPASLTWNLGAQVNAGALVGPVSMRTALANGLAAPAQALVQHLGGYQVAQVLRASGLSAFNRPASEDQTEENILDAAAVTPLELAGAYGSLSNMGSLTGRTVDDQLQASALLFASDVDGDVVLDWSLPEQRSIAGAQLAYLVTDVLADVSVRVQAERGQLAEFGRPAALAPASEDWALAYSPQRVVALHGADSALLAEAFAIAHENLPIQSWPAPGGLSSVMVCVPSGLLPDGDCTETRREIFASGSEPRFADGLYVRRAVNSLNGLLATVFTPEEFVQERIFLNVPADLQNWATAAGLALAPSDYDPLPTLSENVGIEIDIPPRFGEVNGMATVRFQLPDGTVGWDLQAGAGLYPSAWQQLAAGDGSASPLARWDTSALSGLWALQLQAWDAAGNVQRAFTVVTVSD